jgi:uncharacterized protein (AIM24 family)
MHKTLKYVIADNRDFLIFNPVIDHSHAARGLTRPATAAGFIHLKTESTGETSVRCFGKSITLKLESRPEDEVTIARIINS